MAARHSRPLDKACKGIMTPAAFADGRQVCAWIQDGKKASKPSPSRAGLFH